MKAKSKRPNPYGAIIAEARQRYGLSQPHAAEAIGVSLTTIRAWEQGKRLIPIEQRAFLAEQWGIERELLDLDREVCPCCKRPL